MSSSQQYNLRNPAVKRLMKEAQELNKPTELFFAQPLEDNLFEWHFTVRGPPDSEFSDGIYHGRIVLPSEYPMKPPSIMMLTPNGRFELNKKICLSISGYHPESWQPSWSIRTALLAIIGFMPTHGGGAIGSLEYTPEERKRLAHKSHDWRCSSCGCLMSEVLPTLTTASMAATEEAKNLATQMSFKDESEVKKALNEQGDAVSQPESQPANHVQTEPESMVRQRVQSEIVSEVEPVIVPAPVSHGQRSTMVNEGQRTGITLIIVIGMLILVLVVRRLYIMNEWRFHA